MFNIYDTVSQGLLSPQQLLNILHIKRLKVFNTRSIGFTSSSALSMFKINFKHLSITFECHHLKELNISGQLLLSNFF